MPPKSKFTREQIVEAALKMVRERGMEALTARSLGEALQSSARPIFTVFEGGMEEVKRAVTQRAREIYDGYVDRALQSELAFKATGTAYIVFAGKEPQLFRLLFMHPNSAKINNLLSVLDKNYEAILSSVTHDYPDCSTEEADKLYRHLFIYTHGIAVLTATHSCMFSPEEISRMLTEVFQALIKEIRASRKREQA